jgi:hypothetical protein
VDKERKTMRLDMFALAIVLVLWASTVYSKDLKWLAIMGAGSAGDLISTELGLASGAQELNPIAQNRLVRVGLKTGTTIFVWWLAERCDEEGHEKIAKIMRWTHIGTNLGVTSWNVYITISLGGP